MKFQDFSMGRRITLAFQTLGVVFGDVGTSPLYTFSVMFSKAPINGDEDVIGALSLVLYTLILIPLVKYVLVVLWANDDGEGMLILNKTSEVHHLLSLSLSLSK
jgi:K+ transporter